MTLYIALVNGHPVVSNFNGRTLTVHYDVFKYNDFDGSDNTLDSRDVIAAIEELENLAGDGEIDEYQQEMLENLKALADEGASYCADWVHGATLIADHYFTEYAEELAEAAGAIGRNAQWPLRHIDWDAAAEELKNDYAEFTLNGMTYWAR